MPPSKRQRVLRFVEMDEPGLPDSVCDSLRHFHLSEPAPEGTSLPKEGKAAAPCQENVTSGGSSVAADASFASDETSLEQCDQKRLCK